MSDDGVFRLTPQDLRAQNFPRVLRGYDPVQVDALRERVIDEFESLLRERAQGEERLKVMQEQLRGYRERERALNEALVAAQQLRADTRAQAEKDAEQVLREARAEAGRLLAAAKAEAERLVREAQGEAERARDRVLFEERLVRERTEAAVRQYQTYVNAFRALIERQLAELETQVLPTPTLARPADAVGGA